MFRLKLNSGIVFVCVLLVCILITGCKSNDKVVEDRNISKTSLLSRDIEYKDYSSEYVFPPIERLVDKTQEKETINAISDVDLNGNVYPYSFTDFYDDERLKEGYIKLYNAIYNMDAQVEMGDLTEEETFSLFYAMLNDNPDFYYISRDTIWIENEHIFCIEYTMSKEDVLKNSEEIKSRVYYILKQIPEDISRYDLYVWLNDFVIYNVEYLDDSSIMPENIVGGIINHKATCMGFAMTYNYLCRSMGIQVANVFGDFGAGHMWNQVPYEGTYFNVDCTMDNNDTGLLWTKHNFFGIPNSIIKGTLEFSIYERDIVDVSAYSVHPLSGCDNENYYYINRCSISNTDCINEVKNKLETNIKNYGKSYIEIHIDDTSDYNYVFYNVLNMDNDEFFKMFEDIKGDVSEYTVNTKDVGFTYEFWNNSMLIYIGMKKVGG